VNSRLLTARTVAGLLDVAPATVLRWTRHGDLGAIRLPGGAIRYRAEEIDRWLEERTTPTRGVLATTVDTGQADAARASVARLASSEDEEY
jgi:excisionase family DNA binding protein